MPKDKESSNHPCHFLSLPSARRFWCRHCMSVFEDAITRWRHSRTCRYGVVTNFMRRRELEAKALQNTTKPNPIEARLEQGMETPAISSAEESNVEGEGPSSQNGDPEDNGSLFRCFICQSQFSTLEEMRHHVKFPCNHKKTETEDNQAAVTIYIDEFTDRSRPWDPTPQPQQEEVYTSEFVSTVEHPQTVQTSLEVATEPENTVVTAPPIKNQDNITPTNIYVNEQGETVIEVENLDLNSEVGELSLAHLLTQLSQQGIVFDKTKSGQMQARQEMTVTDPSSGKIYTTSSALNYPSVTPGVSQEDDEGQPTAEDAANTLAQLAGFRGFRNSQEMYEGTQVVTNQPKQEQQLIETSQGYDYNTSVPEATSENQVNFDAHNSEAPLKVNYEYEYYPSSQAASTSTGQHIAIQSIVQPGAQEYDNVKIEEEIVHHFPVQFYEDGSSSQGVTYITTQEAQQPDATSIQTVKADAEGVDQQRVIIDNGSGPVIIQQYGVDGETESTSQHFVNFPVQLPVSEAAVSEAEKTNPEIFHNDPHSGQALIKLENSEEIICNPERTVHEGTPVLSVNTHEEISHNDKDSSLDKTEITPSEQIVKISNFTATDDKESENNNEEFTIQTVSLQEIVEAESSNPVSFVDKNEVISTQDTVLNSQEVPSIEHNQFHTVTLDSSSSQSVIHSIDASNQDGATSSDLALANKFVITQSQSTMEQDVSSSTSRPPMPVFVVSSSGLQLVSTDQKAVGHDTQTGL